MDRRSCNKLGTPKDSELSRNEALPSIFVELRVHDSCYLLVVGYLAGASGLQNADFGPFW